MHYKNQPKQNRADSGKAEIEVNPTQVRDVLGHPVVQIGSAWRKKRRRRTCAFDTLLAPVMFRDKSRPITMKSLHVFLDVSQDTQIRERVPK